ncbi:MAG: efflux RND transporter periplasmic adaptor subunit [Betaproteobacteria bacterium]|nr:efflux RND transporter periplasmic adaptor subunit [Betaproteobacteria bacterium]
MTKNFCWTLAVARGGVVVLAMGALLAACGKKDGADTPATSAAPPAAATAGPPPGPSAAGSAASGGVPAMPSAGASAAPAPPVTVTTVKVEMKDLAVRLRSAGVVTPIRTVDVKPQVNSVITKVNVKDGQYVKAGELLFSLDARTEEANIAKAQAQLAKDSAALADAQRQLRRAQDLLARQFISQGSVDTNLAAVESWQATVNADKAAIDATRVAQSYARISAPQSGRVGAVNVSAGSAVEANKTVLVTITQISPIAVTFTLPQRNIADALAGLQKDGAPVTATLPDNGGTFKGKLQFVDSAVDTASGVVKAKAYFKNDDEKLWPGAFVEVQQVLREVKDALVVPQAAVIYGARGTIVYVVENGKAAVRPVKVLQPQGSEVAVSGVEAGESVVLDGKQNLRPGSAVVERAKENKDGPQGAASAAASSASAPNGSGQAASGGADAAGKPKAAP